MSIASGSSLIGHRAQELRESFGLAAKTTGQIEGETSPFVELLGAGVDDIKSAQDNSESQIQALLSGENVSPAEVFTSVQKAEMAFSLLVQIRNKLMQAYQEINAIQI